jgi:ornithine cyclodeaminase
MIKNEFIYLTQEEVIATGIGMERVLEIVESVLGLHGSGEVNLPSKVILDMGEKEHGRINDMPAYVGGEFDMCGIKWIAGFPKNPVKYGIPRAHALTIVNDAQTGVPLAVMDGTYINAMRTGAVTGVGAKYLARADSQIVGIIGCGVQARTQIMAVKTAIPSIRKVRGFDLRADTALEFLKWVKENLGLECEPAKSAQQAVEGSDIVITVTVADEPIVKDSWLREGSFFAHIGSYQEEEEAVIFNSDKIVVDIWEEVLHRETPLLARLFKAGKIDLSRIHANIGQIIRGIKKGREDPRERILFSPLGLGSEDIGVATVVFREAKKKGIGTILKLWDKPCF